MTRVFGSIALIAGLAAAPHIVAAGAMHPIAEKVQNCWLVDVGAPSAEISVTLAFSLVRDGRVQPSSLRMVSATSGEQDAIERAYASARRAVLRCLSGGIDVPESRYEQWKEIEMTFNPNEMRIR